MIADDVLSSSSSLVLVVVVVVVEVEGASVGFETSEGRVGPFVTGVAPRGSRVDFAVNEEDIEPKSLLDPAVETEAVLTGSAR